MDDSELEMLTQRYGPTTVRAYQALVASTPNSDDPFLNSLLLDQAVLQTKIMKPPPTLGAISVLLDQEHNIKTRMVAPGDQALPPIKSPLYRLLASSRHVLTLVGDQIHIQKLVQRKNVNGKIHEGVAVLEEISNPATLICIADPNSISIIAKKLYESSSNMVDTPNPR